MEEVAHDPVPRRPVVSVARGVVGAEIVGGERRLRALHTKSHQWTPRRLIDPSIAPPRLQAGSPLRWAPRGQGCALTRRRGTGPASAGRPAAPAAVACNERPVRCIGI